MGVDLLRWLSIVVAGSVLAACHDVGTFPDVEKSAPATAAAYEGGSRDPGAVEYVCNVSVATPGGRYAYRYGRMPLQFPQSAMHPANATHRYRYRVVNGNGKALRVASCVVPRTDEAVEIMNRRFEVPDETGDAQVQGCVSEGVCTLDPIIIIGGGGSSGGGWGSGGGGGGDGGGGDSGPGDGQCMASVGGDATIMGCLPGGGDSPDPEDPPAWDDGTGRDPCERDATGWCKVRRLTEEEWTKLVARVEAIREANEVCAGAKQVLRGMIAQGREANRIQFWDGYNMPSPEEQYFGANSSDSSGRILHYDSYWVWKPEKQTLIVHEAIHAYYFANPHPTLQGDALHAHIHQIDDTCV